MDLTERTVERTCPYKGVIVDVNLDKALLPNGREARREVVVHPGGAAALPLNDDGTVTVVRQFRYPFGRILTEIPAGKLDPNEDPRAAIIRELEEEIGAKATELIDLGCMYTSPGITQEVLYLYLARGLTYGEVHPDEDEFLEIARVPFDDLLEQVMAGEIRDGKTVTAVLKTKLLLQK